MVLLSLGIRAQHPIPDISVLGGGLSWRELARQADQTAGIVLVVFGSYARAPVPEDYLIITLDEDRDVLWSVDEIPNVTPGGLAVGRPFRHVSSVAQLAQDKADASALTLTLPAATVAKSRGFSAWFRNGTETFTPSSGWTTLADRSDSLGRLVTQYSMGPGQTNNLTFTSSGVILGAMMEFGPMAAGPRDVVVNSDDTRTIIGGTP